MGSREERERREDEVVEYLRQRAEEVGFRATARRNHSITTTAGREMLFMGQLREVFREVFDQTLADPRVKIKKPKGPMKRALNLVISDTHYGSNLDPREVGHKYGPVEEARRTAHIIREVALYKLDHRDETMLNLHILGDIIQGQLHDMRDGLPLAEQVATALRILVQAVRFLAVEFPRGVTVRCRPGNHGRNTARHRDRAVNQKWDAIETMLYSGLKEACSNLSNVDVQLGYDPEYYWEDFGKVGMGTHGDTVINPGYPGKSINVAGISRQVDRINNSRTHDGLQPLSIVVVGHVHTGSMTHLQGGTVAITNSCIIPPDSYAKSIGIVESACGQWMWESVPDHAPGDVRFITVGYDTDKDESLDSIIKPFVSL